MNFVGDPNGVGKMGMLYEPDGYTKVWGFMMAVFVGLAVLFWVFGLFNRFLCECCSPDEKKPFPRCCFRMKDKRV
jgi:hypothetical protein